MSIAEGVSIVFHEELKSFGVAFSSQKALVKNTPPLQDLYCYGFNNKADYRYPTKGAGQQLFIPFSAMAEKRLNPVGVVESSILKPTESQNASHFDKSNMVASNGDNYLPAYVPARRDIGLAFPSYDKVCSFICKYDDLFDDDDNIPDFSEDQLVFLSMTSMLSRGKAEFAVYRKEELSVYYQIVQEDTNDAPSTNLIATNCTAASGIACVDKNEDDSGRTPHAACSADPFKSEGLTTVATEDSERIDARLESTERISSDAISAGGNRLWVPGPSDIWKDTGYDVYSTGRESAAPRVRSQAGGRGGGVEQSEAELGAEFYRRYWGVLKTAGWKCIYFKSSVLLHVGKEIEVYMTPMVALRTHVLENPCLLANGREELWTFLSSAGWVEVHADDGRTKNNYCPSYYTLSFAQKYLKKNGGLSEPMPGLHKFTSFTSLAVYIHRFPFLLQSEDTFISTLKRLKWVVNEKKKVHWTADDSELHAELNLKTCGLSGKAVKWVSLDLLKQLLWMDPASLFRHTSCEDAISQSIRLDTDFASLPDPGPFSPFVAGLTRAERDAHLIELVRLFQSSKTSSQKSAEVNEAAISRHLQDLHWKHEPASFLKSALKCEYAWIAPWLSSTCDSTGEGDQPQLGHDYFWTLSALGKFVDVFGMEAILRKPKQKTINKSESVNDQANLLSFKLRSLANMQQRSANDDALMTELLELAGWKIQRRDNGESLYIPGWSVASKAGYDWNLCDYTEGHDFFESKDDAIDHLASHGNFPVKAVVVTSDHESESASSPGSNRDSQVEASQSDSSCDLIHHLGQDYDSSSHEGLIIQNLRDGLWFPTVIKNLRYLGWFIAYDKKIKTNVICAPWASDVPAAFPKGDKKVVTTSNLNANSDYFIESDEGKNELYKYLQEVGFSKICDNQLKGGGLHSLASSVDVTVNKLDTSSDSSNLKTVRLSSSPTKKHSINHLGIEYDLKTYQGKVVETLAQQKPYFGTIYDNLKKIGWTSQYEKTLKATLICAPWAQDVPQAFEENKKCRLQNFTLLKENVDYFVESESGKSILIDYLKRFGFNRSCPIDMDSNKKRKHVVSQEAETDSIPLKFKAISPQNPCYRAADPSKAIIRHISDVQSPEISSIPMVASCADVDYDDLQAIMSLQSPTADDRVVSENEEQCELYYFLLRGERDIGKILSYLRPLGWTWNYPNKRLAALGYNVIYLRPGCTIADEAKLIRDEDIFYSADELVEYLMNQFGIKTDIVDKLAPRRITRHGKSSDTSNRDPVVAGSPPVVLSKASNVINRNRESKENLGKEETLSILDRINIAKNNLHLLTVGQVTRDTECCLAPIERSGSLKIIMDEIVDALENARGSAIYVCGSPGVGKTLTVLTAIKELSCRYDRQVKVNRSIRASHSPRNSSSYADSSIESLGFNVVLLNGADLIRAHEAFVLIAEAMKLFNGTAYRSDSMHLIYDHFRRAGAAVDFAGIGGSSSRKNSCTPPMTILCIDELDLVHKDVLAHLMRCSCMAPSSLVLLGIGNNITLLRQSAAVQVVFEPYSPQELASILNRSTANIFTRNAASFLVGKVIRNNKGDVRALLNIAEMSIKIAERDARADRREIVGLDGTTHLVDISHVRQVCDVKDRTLEMINGLAPKSRTLLVVSLLVRLDQWHDGMLSLGLLTNAYNSFASQKGISLESTCSVQRMLDELQAYCIMEATTHRSSTKANYRLLVDASVVIQADLGSILLLELKRAMALAEQLKKETQYSRY